MALPFASSSLKGLLRATGPPFESRRRNCTLSHMLTVLIATLAAEAPGQSPQEEAYLGCVMREAERLTPSGETAEVVSRVALVKCQNKRAAALREFHRGRLKMLRSKGVSGTMSESHELLQELAEDLAEFVIVETRAAQAQ